MCEKYAKYQIRECKKCGPKRCRMLRNGLCPRCVAQQRRWGNTPLQRCVDCGLWRQCNADGECRWCENLTEAAIERIVAEQLKNAPPWFWREARALEQAYDLPEWCQNERKRQTYHRDEAKLTNGVCAVCGKNFTRLYARAVYCGRACKARAWRDKQKAVAHAG
jgi:hypothetical protein